MVVNSIHVIRTYANIIGKRYINRSFRAWEANQGVMEGKNSVLPSVLPKAKVPALFHEPFIETAYRRPFCGPVQCVKYAFTLHNDVGNFWTHFITFLAWIIWYIYITTEHDLSSDYYMPLVYFWIGSCSYALFSSLAHLFSPLSEVLYHVCFMLDYCGISLYAYSAGIAYYYYERPLTVSFYDWEKINIAIHVVITVGALFFSCMSRFLWGRYRYTIRALSFSPPFFINLTPVILRWLECHGNECVPDSYWYHYLAILFTFLLVFHFVTKIPERLAPGKFDLFIQSHQLFHIFSALATTNQLALILTDSRARQDTLTKNGQVTGVFPSKKIYHLFLITLAVKLCIVCALGVLLKKGIVKNNKKQEHIKSF